MAGYKNKAEELEVRINNRCLDRNYPNLSDLLGSDWMCAYPLRERTPEEYRDLAIRFAYQYYGDK